MAEYTKTIDTKRGPVIVTIKRLNDRYNASEFTHGEVQEIIRKLWFQTVKAKALSESCAKHSDVP